MRRKLTIELETDTQKQLDMLSSSLGYPPELAAVYAIRLVSACIREGLIDDVPARAWPKEAQLLTGTGGKVISFAQSRKMPGGK